MTYLKNTTIADQYLDASFKTISPQDEDQRKVHPNRLNEAVTIADAGNLADYLKRKIFYKDGKASDRFNALKVKLDDLKLKLSDLPDTTVLDQDTMDLLHAALGVGSEGGEIMEEFLTSLVEGRKVDSINMMEEVGDVLWYLAIICRICGFTLEQAMEKNIAKLAARYPNKFNVGDAVDRDLVNERKVLEA